MFIKLGLGSGMMRMMEDYSSKQGMKMKNILDGLERSDKILPAQSPSH
jgi:hypothetical protein